MLLDFDPVNHLYKLNGSAIPSVTQLMKPLSQKAYDGIDPAIMDAAAARGTAVHEAAEFYALYGVCECPEEYAGYMEAYKAWFSEHKVLPIYTEQMLYHTSLLYAGTIDLIADIEGKITLVDYKTTRTIKDMLTRVQLEAYARMFETHGEKIQQKAILQLKPDGTYEFRTYKMHDVEAWDVFTSLIKIRAYTEKYGG